MFNAIPVRRNALLRLLTITVVLYSINFAEAATQATFYVDPSYGNNANSGTSTANAFKTIERARLAVAGVNSNMTGDIIVFLRAGTYWLTGPLVFNPSDSGTNGYHVYYRNLGTEIPVISGGVNLTGGWTLYDASKGIYKKTGVAGSFRQLYVNNLRTDRARSPNKTNNKTFGPYYSVLGVDPSSKTVKIPVSQISNWPGLTSVEMVMHPHWYQYRGRISSFATDAAYAYVTFKAPENAYLFLKPASFWETTPYFFENAYAFLDAPGEWFLDEIGDALYYKPKVGENMSTVSIVAPVQETLFRIGGASSNNKVKYLAFQGVTFSYSNWTGPSASGSAMTQGARELVTAARPGAISVCYADVIDFESCTFKFLGGAAVSYLRGVTNSSIIGCDFVDLSGNGVVIHDDGVINPITGDKCDSLLIANNYFTRVGQDYLNGISIVSYFAQRLTVEANEISNSPYMGIQIGGQSGSAESGMKNNIIRHNRIHDVMQFLDDGAAVYTLGKQQGTLVFENFANNLIATNLTGTSPVAGIYADNYSQLITFEHNATVNTGIATFENTIVGVKNNVWRNNVSNLDSSIVTYAGNTAAYTVPVRLEAEGMSLINYTIESDSSYSNNSGVKANVSTTGVAKTSLSGANGNYSVDVAYIIEDDGNANYRLYVGGTQVGSWTAEPAVATTGMQTRHKVIHNVTINSGQEIRVEGVQKDGSHARLDYIELYVRNTALP